MKPMAKGELKSVKKEYEMMLNYFRVHQEDIFEKAFAGISDFDRYLLQEDLEEVVNALHKLKARVEDILEAQKNVETVDANVGGRGEGNHSG